ncbi:MAG: MnhB domain-containing protein [Anaerovoracaceae bacterium]|jgi:multicomponent Na+:H+ antiporter subunit B
MKKVYGSIILDTAFRYLIPFILLYGVYVLLHGEYSPGGGFQAGAILGIAFVLDGLVQGKKAILKITGETAVIIAGIGTFLYCFVGILSMLSGGNFLEYSLLPLPMNDVEKHVWGILGIETGVGICVMFTIIAIFYALVGKEE